MNSNSLKTYEDFAGCLFIAESHAVTSVLTITIVHYYEANECRILDRRYVTDDFTSVIPYGQCHMRWMLGREKHKLTEMTSQNRQLPNYLRHFEVNTECIIKRGQNNMSQDPSQKYLLFCQVCG